METKCFPNRLKEFRDIHGLTQKDVAFLLGIQGSTRVGQWERGIKTPCISHLLKLSMIYRVLVNDLYFELSKEYRDEITRKRELLLVEKSKTHIPPL